MTLEKPIRIKTSITVELEYLKLAHDNDINLSALVEKLLRTIFDNPNDDPLKAQKAKMLIAKAQYEIEKEQYENQCLEFVKALNEETQYRKNRNYWDWVKSYRTALSQSEKDYIIQASSKHAHISEDTAKRLLEHAIASSKHILF